MKTVEAVKTLEDITKIKEALLNHKGQIYSDIWVFGIQAASRISDLLDITIEDALKGKLELVEGKTKKSRTITLNDTAMEVVKRRAKLGHTYLFQVVSNRASEKPISRISVARAFKEVGDMHSIQVKLGTHSMRKTLGWVMHSGGKSLELIARVLNHSTPAVTMAYIGLTEQEVQDSYIEFEIKC